VSGPPDLDRRAFLTAGGSVIAAAGLLMPSRPARSQRVPSGQAASTLAQTTAGKIRGLQVNGVHVFKGVPYGASTAAQRRFMAPALPTPWTGVRDATRYGPQSPQLTPTMLAEAVIALDNSPETEDCLRLNVWTAGLRDGRKRPVMVWFHGGGFTGGSGGAARYDGSNLARKHDVVLVTVNERLNAFGFLYLAPLGGEKYADSGNAGLLDLVASLRWVRDNIAEFGGDAGNVTIFGQSGGGGKTTTLMATPAARGLFHRAVAQSGVNLRGIAAETATEVARRVMARMGLALNQVDELQRAPVDRILAVMNGLSPAPGPTAGTLQFGPVIDGRTLLASPFDPVAPSLSADVPLLTGSTLTETTFELTTPRDPIDDVQLRELVKQNLQVEDSEVERFIALYRKGYPGVQNTRLYQILSSDHWLTADTALLAERKAALNAAPAYVYHFEKLSPVEHGRLGAPHTLEIPYVFDNIDVATVDTLTGTGHDRYQLAAAMSSAWTNFARTGNPDVPGLPRWTPYSADHRAVMAFNDECHLQIDPHHEQREAMQALHAQTRTRGA
jgi:para-nitrobenzyl esterase